MGTTPPVLFSGNYDPFSQNLGDKPWVPGSSIPSPQGSAFDPSSLSSIFSNPTNGLITGLAGAAGAFPTPGHSATSGTSDTKFGSVSNPILSAGNTALLNQLTNQYQHLASTGSNLAPYQQQQEQGINQNSQMAQRASQEALAARGLSNSPVAGTVAANQEGSRIGQITQLQQSVPLLQQQLQTQNMNAASGFAASIPHGTSTTGEQTGAQNSNTSTSQGGGAGGFLGGLGKAIGGIAGVASMFSDKRLKENVADTTDGLEKILKMKPKEYNYKGDNKVSSGFMAQDLEKLFPSVVHEHESGFKMVKYHELLPKIVKGMQEMNDKFEKMGKDVKSSQVKKVAA